MAKPKDKSVSRAARAFGSLGGRARAKRLSAEERQAIAKKAAGARWAKAKKGRKGAG
jgi:hypothetical protein